MGRSGTMGARQICPADADDPFLEGPVLPNQLLRSGQPSRGVPSLMLAVLQDGIESFLGNRSEGEAREKYQREAEDWIFSNDRSSLFGFVNLCDALDLDPEYLRSQLIALQVAVKRDPVTRKKTRSSA